MSRTVDQSTNVCIHYLFLFLVQWIFGLDHEKVDIVKQGKLRGSYSLLPVIFDSYSLFLIV